MAKKGKPANEHLVRIAELFEAADGLGRGPVQVGVLEEAVRVADAAGDVEAGYEARLKLVDAGTFGGAQDVVLVAFAWCLAQCDKDPERFNTFSLMWKYKWVVVAATRFPEVSRERITALLADMSRRYEEAGCAGHPVHQKTREVLLRLGDLDAARDAQAKVNQSEPTFLSDCPACEQNEQVEFYVRTGRPAVALRKAEPILAGRMKCGEVPHLTYPKVLLPLLANGDAETAADYHRKGVRLIGANPAFLNEAAGHLIFLTLTDNLAAAARLLEKHLPNAIASTDLSDRFELYRSAALLCDRVADAGGKLRLRAPDDTPGYPADRTDPVAVRDWFLSVCRAIATAFDVRNGNDSYARRLAELAELKKQVKPYPLSAG